MSTKAPSRRSTPTLSGRRGPGTSARRRVAAPLAGAIAGGLALAACSSGGPSSIGTSSTTTSTTSAPSATSGTGSGASGGSSGGSSGTSTTAPASPSSGGVAGLSATELAVLQSGLSLPAGLQAWLGDFLPDASLGFSSALLGGASGTSGGAPPSGCQRIPGGSGSTPIAPGLQSEKLSLASGRLTYGFYRGTNCTGPILVDKASGSGSEGTSFTVRGTRTYYDTAGHETFRIADTFVGMTWSGKEPRSVDEIAVSTPGGAPFAHLDVSCAQGGSYGVATCHDAVLDSPAGTGLALASDTYAVAAAGKGTVDGLPNYTLTVSDTTTRTAHGGLSLVPGGPPALGVRGGSAGPALTVTNTFNLKSALGFLYGAMSPGLTWTLADAHDGLRLAFASSSAGGGVVAKGTLVDTSSGKTLATVSVDEHGLGSITTAGGSSVPVAGWMVH